jgi:predicted dehydrogenase
MKIGIVGAGSIVKQRHLPGLRKLEDIEITAVANSSLASSERFCAEFAPEALPVERWQDLVTRPDLDAVWVGATPYLHAPVTIAALEAGKNVFCQARMARDLDEAKRMFAAAVAHPELVTMLCPPPQGLRGDAYIKKLLAEHSVGTILHIHLQSLNGGYLDPSAPPHWRQRREISGANVLTLGIHTEVLQRWLGDFQATAVTMQTATPVRAGYRIEIPDAIQVQAQFENGASGLLEFSGIQAGQAVEHLQIEGTEGTLSYDYLKEEITLHRRGKASAEQLEIPDALAGEWQVEVDFVKAVRDPSQPRPHPDFHDGLRYMRVVQQVDELRKAQA